MDESSIISTGNVSDQNLSSKIIDETYLESEGSELDESINIVKVKKKNIKNILSSDSESDENSKWKSAKSGQNKMPGFQESSSFESDSEKPTTSYRLSKVISDSESDKENIKRGSTKPKTYRNLKNISDSESDKENKNVECHKKSTTSYRTSKLIFDSESEEEYESISKQKLTSLKGSATKFKKVNRKDFDEISETDSEDDILNISVKLDTTTLSGDAFADPKVLFSSTILEDVLSTPKSNLSSKRLLNRSVETPRTFKQPKESSIIDISSDESDNKTAKVLEEHDCLKIKTEKTLLSNTENLKKDQMSEKIEVSRSLFLEQRDKVRELEVDVQKSTNLMRTVNLENLPDKGKLLLIRHTSIQKALQKATVLLENMVVTIEDISEANIDKPKSVHTNPVKPPTWDELEANAVAVQPKTFGKTALSTYNAQKAVTMDRLQQLHGSLETCPKESTLEEDPRNLNVNLMPHQQRALAWLKWREQQKPSGGILADDMGLGKTLTMISLMLKQIESEGRYQDDDTDEENEEKINIKGGTLVICPATLLNQWSGELENRTRRGLASCEVFHGPKRETKPRRLAKYDMVVTTYTLVMNECEKNGVIFRIKWRRVVIDEGHQIRNSKSQTSVAVCQIPAKSRWVLTGTPIHNKEMDMYALLKFIRCSPFDDLAVWKRWIGDKSTGGQERLHTLISSLMLRRTKAELIEKGLLANMPPRKWELITIQMEKAEMDVYQKVLLFSKTLFAQFLHQRAEKNQDAVDAYQDLGVGASYGAGVPNQEYFKMRSKLLHMNKLKDIKQHEILVLLLRLRQICCHPSLITAMLNEDLDFHDADDEESVEMNLLDQLNKLDLEGSSENVTDPLDVGTEAPGLKEAAGSLLNPSNPVFNTESLSSKIGIMLKVLKEKVLLNDDKAIIVSQWPSFLRIIGYHLRKNKIMFDQLDGGIPVPKRMEMVNRFNNPNDKMSVLLLSLTAGGVGLNLVGANHLFLLDLHWNPQLEKQAQDRIYRVGQTKPVFIYKFMALDSIEKRILDLQEKKLDIANSMITGTKQVIASKLSLQDLKMLFEMGN